MWTSNHRKSPRVREGGARFAAWFGASSVPPLREGGNEKGL